MRATLTFLLLITMTQVAALDVKSVFETTRPSVVLIVAYDENDQPIGMGSGFFFGDTKTLATNLHVVQNASKLAIKLSSGETGWIDTVLGVDAGRDLALLQSSVPGTPIKAAGRLPDIGEDILAIGNPSGLEGTVSTGIISGIRTEDGSQYFQITAPISPGSSGGPIIDENSEVLGVSTFYLDGAQSLNFAMPAAYLMKLYNNRNKTSLSTLKKTPKKKLNRAEENVVILSPIWETCYTSKKCDFSFSIGNKSQYEIFNVKLLIKFYKNLDDELPLHFVLKSIQDTIPSRLSKRILVTEREMRVIGKYEWKMHFTVMDYEINQDSSSGTLLNFD